MRRFPSLFSALLLSAVAVQAHAQQQPQPTPEQRQALQARWKAADSNNDGYIDRGEAQAMGPIAKHFDELDADKDGKLSVDEMRNSVQSRLHAADTNQDGAIDRAEAEASLPRVAKAFDRLDTDKDGKLTVEEVQELASGFAGRRQR